MEYRRLWNGVEMPMLGYGVWQIPDDKAEECVSQALELGYRLIDTARFYENERGVGRAIAKSGIDRSELFIVDKVWPGDFGEERTYAAIRESLERTGLDYFDLLFIHQAYNDVFGAWRAFERAYDEGLVRAIGVSNFNVHRLIDICGFCRIKPMVNQVETHVFWQQRPLREVMDELEVAHMAWGPFAENMRGIFDNEILVRIGEAHGKSAAQVALRFLVENGIVAIPKSAHAERMAANIDIFDFELSPEEADEIRAMDEDKPSCVDHSLVETTKMMVGLSQYLAGGGTLAQLAAQQG